jgi:LEA14-like dessication related protein
MIVLARCFILALLALFAAGCATLADPDFDDPQVEVIAIKPLSSSGFEARFLISLRVLNPNDVDLDIQGIYYELDVQGSRLLSGTSAQPVTVPAYGEAVVELDGAASMLGSLSLVRELMSSPPEGGITYELNAKISISKWLRAVRVKREGRLGGPAS